MQRTEQGVRLYKHCSLTVEEHHSQHLHNLSAGRMKFLDYCITKDGEFGGQGLIPAAVAGTVKTLNYISKHKTKCTIEFRIIFNFHSNIFYLFGALKKPPKRTVTYIYKLDRKRLCIHSLTNHLSEAENFICPENYENRNCVQKYKYLYSLQAPHIQQLNSEEHLQVIE